MARITEHRDIPLDDLVIGQGQVRVSSPGKGVDELARSIDAQGLLLPAMRASGRSSRVSDAFLRTSFSSERKLLPQYWTAA